MGKKKKGQRRRASTQTTVDEPVLPPLSCAQGQVMPIEPSRGEADDETPRRRVEEPEEEKVDLIQQHKVT